MLFKYTIQSQIELQVSVLFQSQIFDISKTIILWHIMVTQSKNNNSPILDFYEDLKISSWEKNETKMDEKGKKSG